MPDPIMGSGINGPFMFIHEVTGTYLETDNYNDNVGQAVQTWNLDPVTTNKGQLGHLWYIESTDEAEVCLIKSYENSRCLTAGSSAKDYPRLQEPDGSRKQEWIVRRVHGSDHYSQDADSYVLISREYPSHALGLLNNVDSNDVYVVPTSMWGGAASISQYWKPVLQSEGASGS